jgi:hypothetical protein
MTVQQFFLHEHQARILDSVGSAQSTAPSRDAAGQPSPARITEIDIDKPARALAVLRWSDYVLVVMCGLALVGVVPELLRAGIEARWSDAAIFGVASAALAFAVHTGWRHVGVIDPRVWKSYVWVFPLLAVPVAFIMLQTVMTWIAQHVNPVDNVSSFMSLFAYLQLIAVAIPGFIYVRSLQRTRIAPMGVRLQDLLADLTARGGESAQHATTVPRISVRRGLAFAVAGGLVLLAVIVMPFPEKGQQASNAMRATQQLTVLAFFLLVRARRYFQVSADSLLAVDKRPPILFLRSFADDERQQYANSQRALLDFSLETRLANHFHRFGPFIAVGSPKETVPQPGAARVLLADSEWQSRVVDWMKESNLIIMYCGTTQWVNWELRKVVESGRATSLILMFPEIKSRRAAAREGEIASRVEQVRDVFRDTPWNEELREFADFAGLRAMLFCADGSMIMIKSKSRTREAYHLAALIAHRQLLEPLSVTEGSVVSVGAPRLRRMKALIGTLTAAAALSGGVFALGSDRDYRLTFKQGELYYKDPVTQVEAQGVGEYLVRHEIFSDRKAATVQLYREPGVYRLRFVVDPAYADNVLAGIEFGVMGDEISREVLGGTPIEVALFDKNLKPIKVVPTSAKLVFGKGELYYTAPITVDEARQVGGQLRRSEFFDNEIEAAVHLGREQDSYQLRFVIDPSRAGDPEIVDGFRRLTAAVAAHALRDQPVVLHLCDNEFHSLKTVRVDPSRTGTSPRREARVRGS